MPEWSPLHGADVSKGTASCHCENTKGRHHPALWDHSHHLLVWKGVVARELPVDEEALQVLLQAKRGYCFSFQHRPPSSPASLTFPTAV
eukprot:5865717-Amphidinium_carterae.2